MHDLSDALWMDRDQYENDHPKTKQCKLCGKDGFHWGKTNTGRWRLYDEDGIIHDRCLKKRNQNENIN